MTGPSEKSELRLEYDPLTDDAPPAYKEQLEPGPSQSSLSSTFGRPSPPLPTRTDTGSSYATSSSSTKAHEEDIVSLQNPSKSALIYYPPPSVQVDTQIHEKFWQNADSYQPVQTRPLLPQSYSTSSGKNPLSVEFPNPQPFGFAPISDYRFARASLAGSARELHLNRVGFMRGVGAASSIDPFNPPPPSFSRPPQPQFPYSPFPRCTTVSFGKDLENGFPSLPPPSAVQPHPFVTHDVNEDDWLRFLGDIMQIGSSNSTQLSKFVAIGGPIGLGVGLMGEYSKRSSGVSVG